MTQKSSVVQILNSAPQGLTSDNNGIDLVLKHRNGETWAVQAKCYDPVYTVTKSNIDSFISESGRPQIQGRLLMASCEIGAKVSKTIKG
ncbi:MAG: restriction endonuclease [Rhodobacteraceae bacterium]|nr:restriction endonuclease [Paracoccaceae bacterium]